MENGWRRGYKEWASEEDGWARMVEQSENGKGRTEDGRGRRVRIGKGNDG